MFKFGNSAGTVWSLNCNISNWNSYLYSCFLKTVGHGYNLDTVTLAFIHNYSLKLSQTLYEKSSGYCLRLKTVIKHDFYGNSGSFAVLLLKARFLNFCGGILLVPIYKVCYVNLSSYFIPFKMVPYKFFFHYKKSVLWRNNMDQFTFFIVQRS